MADTTPGHYTESQTRKYQANGPISWGVTFRKVAGRDGREGEGIRAALAFAVEKSDQFQAWAENHPTLWAPASTAPKAPKAKAKAKAPKAPKAKAKAPKAPRAAKAPKAPKAKAPEQTTIAGTEAK